MDAEELISLVEEGCEALPAVERIERAQPDGPVGKDSLVRVVIKDFVPGQEGVPWVLFVWSNASYTHPFFNTRYQCIELSLDMAEIETESEAYGMILATYALPTMESQRYCPGASLHWDVEGGHLSVCGQVRLTSQPYDAVVEQLRDMIRSIIGLTYLITFKLWQMQPIEYQRLGGHQIPEQVVHDRMMALLGFENGGPEISIFVD